MESSKKIQLAVVTAALRIHKELKTKELQNSLANCYGLLTLN